jgi:predicted nucleotidyltransferase
METGSVDPIVEELRTRLSDMPIKRIVLFGSSRHGSRQPDSDLDLAIVVDQPTRFASYDERLDLKASIRARIRDINRNLPVDLLVYTVDEFNRLAAEDSFLSREVIARGRTVYAETG